MERGEPDGMHLRAGKHEDVGEAHLGQNLGQGKLEREAKEDHGWEKGKEE